MEIFKLFREYADIINIGLLCSMISFIIIMFKTIVKNKQSQIDLFEQQLKNKESQIDLIDQQLKNKDSEIIRLKEDSIENISDKIYHYKRLITELKEIEQTELNNLRSKYESEIKELMAQNERLKETNTNYKNIENIFVQQSLKKMESDDMNEKIKGINMMIGLNVDLTIKPLIEYLFDENTTIRRLSQTALQSIPEIENYNLVAQITSKIRSASHEAWYDLISFLKKISKDEDYKKIAKYFETVSMGDPILETHFRNNF